MRTLFLLFSLHLPLFFLAPRLLNVMLCFHADNHLSLLLACSHHFKCLHPNKESWQSCQCPRQMVNGTT